MINRYRNNKTGVVYVATGCALNATNAQNGQRMIVYREPTSDDSEHVFVREESEFFEKFTRIPEEAT